MSQQKIVRLTLTEQQKAAVKAAIKRDGEALELSVEELEERITPSLMQ